MHAWLKTLLDKLAVPRVATTGARPQPAPLAIIDAASHMTPAHEMIDATQQETIAQWIAAQAIGELAFGVEQCRVITQAIMVIRALAPSATSNLLRPGSTPPVMYLMPILPASWSMDQRRVAGLWLRDVVTGSGWPSERLALSAEVPADARATAPSAVLTRLAYHGALSGMPLAGLVIAAGPQAAGLLLVDGAQAEARGLVHTFLQPGKTATPQPSSAEAVRFMAELAATHHAAIERPAPAPCINNHDGRPRSPALVRDAAPVPPFMP